MRGAARRSPSPGVENGSRTRLVRKPRGWLLRGFNETGRL
jgi:hypothetical protein